MHTHLYIPEVEEGSVGPKGYKFRKLPLIKTRKVQIQN